jgi:hypothetical protein
LAIELTIGRIGITLNKLPYCYPIRRSILLIDIVTTLLL